MNANPKPRSLREVLRDAAQQRPAGSWLFLPDIDEPGLDTACLVLGDDAYDEHSEAPLAIELGFPVDGLEVAALEDTAEWARQFADPPRDELLLESFLYYCRFDAFLPHPGAGAPPSNEEALARMDREFYLSLGAERKDKPCRTSGCDRGAVAQSVFCRMHHFEMIERRACPFDD